MTNRSNFNLGDYLEVKDRLVLFYERYPEGTLQSEVVELTDSRVTVKAWAYRTPDDQRPGVGHSYLNIPGTTQFTRGSEIENAETSAWGRALAAIGIATGKSIASRDEIDSKRHDNERYEPSQTRVGPNPRPPQPREAPTTTERERRGWGEAMQEAMKRESGSLQQGMIDVSRYLGEFAGTTPPEGAAFTDAVDAWLEANPLGDVRDLGRLAAERAKETANAQA